MLRNSSIVSSKLVTVQKATAMLLLYGIALVISTIVGMAVLALYHPWLLRAVGRQVAGLAPNNAGFVEWLCGRKHQGNRRESRPLLAPPV
jgi:hypothetical protein